MMLRLSLTLLSIFFIQCSKPEQNEPITEEPLQLIKAADLSFLPEAELNNAIYLNKNNQNESPLITLKNSGCNYIRMRIWHSPTSVNSSLEEVKALANRVRQHNMKVWLTVHYSDTWADPGQQQTPAAWQNLSFDNLKSEMVSYTDHLLNEINPDMIQIGNEINSGILFPYGNLMDNEQQCLELIQITANTIRIKKPNCKIMLHYAGIEGSTWFFDKMKTINYDYIGLSYYPIWHGKSIDEVSTTMQSLGNQFNKKVVIAETAYPFTLLWNDWTNNIVGLQSQLIPAFPATPTGQKNFLNAIKNIHKTSHKYLGFCYWGTEWTSFRGPQATDGSSWENQALWNFDNKVLPVMEIFGD